MTKPFPARVHILLAREALTAVAIRRGPAREVCTVSWDRAKDTFAVGQWFRGRIYERRCDLSPDGRHLIYFAHKGKTRKDVADSWTALSRAPYLKALGLWQNGSAWNGGGTFLSNREYWINGFAFGHIEVRSPRGLEARPCPFTGRYGGECPGVYYNVLQRDGWTLRELGRPDVFEKSLLYGWTLRKLAHGASPTEPGRAVYYDTHVLERGDERLERPDWSWAEWDPKRSRLVWVERGVLYAASLSGDGLDAPHALYDFTPLRFENIEAPY